MTEALQHDPRVLRAQAHADAVGLDWFMWRVVRAGKGSLADLKTTWTCHDLFDAHAVIDLDTAEGQVTQEFMAAEQAQAQRKH